MDYSKANKIDIGELIQYFPLYSYLYGVRSFRLTFILFFLFIANGPQYWKRGWTARTIQITNTRITSCALPNQSFAFRCFLSLIHLAATDSSGTKYYNLACVYSLFGMYKDAEQNLRWTFNYKDGEYSSMWRGFFVSSTLSLYDKYLIWVSFIRSHWTVLLLMLTLIPLDTCLGTNQFYHEISVLFRPGSAT